jgi:HEAT repeat protein
MTLLQVAIAQAQVWSAYTRLHNPQEELHWSASRALVAYGPVSLPCLRFAVGAHHPPHVRFAAAVALHQLGDARGLPTLIEALRTLPPDLPAMAAELTRALVTVGAPDAVTALINVFPRLEWRDPHVLNCVCGVWSTLRDPRAIPVLIADGHQFPEHFERTLPVFGEMAIPALERMAHADDVSRNLLAVRALRHIHSPNSFRVLRELLRAAEPTLRSEACNALRGITLPGAARAAAGAVLDGFSTREAVELIVQGDTPGPALSALIQRRAAQPAGPSGDTPDAIIAALAYYVGLPATPQELMPPLARLISRDPDPRIAAAAARIIAYGPPVSVAAAESLQEPLLSRLSDTDQDLRATVGAALHRLGDPVGALLNARLTQAMPTEGLLTKIQALLRGGPEAGQVATQTVQQVSQWVTRLSRETVERINSGAGGTAREEVTDPRLSHLVRDLLRNALTALMRAVEPIQTGEMLGLCLAAVKVLARLPEAEARGAHKELVRALHTVKRISLRDWTATEGSPSDSRDIREVAEPLRTAAANLLVQAEGQACLPTLLEALHSPDDLVVHAAITALGRLGDGRALPRLQAIAADATHPVRLAATEAVATIRRLNPEMMTLLRAAPTDSQPDSLLRPSYGNNTPVEPDKLLRPALGESEPPR